MSTTTLTTEVDVNYKETRVSLSAASTTSSATIGWSSSTLNTLTNPSASSGFSPSRVLHIDAAGIRACRLPLPQRQTEIAICQPDGQPAYVSTRDRRWSGNSVLAHPKRGNLIRTDYFFGPGRDPVLRLLQTTSVLPDEIKVSGEWTSRTAQFFSPAGISFEWVYKKEKRSDGKKARLIVLQTQDDKQQPTTLTSTPAPTREMQPIKEKSLQAAVDVSGHRILARLVRDRDSRTPGTSRCDAGNGGRLELDNDALQAVELDEAIVVATCLVMLKKEVDRRRMLQMMVIAGAAGGGS
ncbi:hypothetical protein N7462_011038 [Penicillium macrosclerotiorum]|uniref:uncharacterized protein n=1 Tax=Penicillium macrosclerotiorum TaxID=303699 RepID=UPI0025472153|nr:uncharacterized protein N7462_011038 [Penicillium macrosclerotiorum]KAJ5666629.1 hypothetical protein N7462_011038 [Penicillium macrosclerotiorum]